MGSRREHASVPEVEAFTRDPVTLIGRRGESLDTHAGPVELVLGGDFFDFLRIAEVPRGQNRASATIERPEYRELFDGQSGNEGVVVNSGCWLRQLQPVRALFGSPPVFVSRFVQTHVRVYRENDAIQVELWEHPRPAPQRLRVAERLAILGRLPAEPEDRSPRVRAAAVV